MKFSLNTGAKTDIKPIFNIKQYTNVSENTISINVESKLDYHYHFVRGLRYKISKTCTSKNKDQQIM